ncbi:MAG: M28 family peptidase [bacterium]
MKRKYLPLSIFLLFYVGVFAQDPNSDSAVIRRIFDEALLRGKSYDMLGELCKKAPHRLSGSENAAIAVEWAKAKMEALGFDTVFLQPVMVPHWVRGEKETAKILSKSGKKKVNICALGGSVGTGKKGIQAPIIEVKGIDELEKLGKEKVEGKIVFYSRPMDARHILTFHAYGGCVDQRVWGAVEAAKYGAAGVIVRSMNLRTDEFPHTGAMAYNDSITKIPAAAISTLHADQLSHLLQNEPDLEFYFKMSCETLPDVLSYNVIGEMRGSEFPDEYIVAGGHLDAWDNGEGAHDDGAGCIQSIEAVRLFKALGKRPKRTLRAVLFMNEENGLRGAKLYASIADSLKVNHIAAIESDAGGFAPRGFRLDGDSVWKEKVRTWKNLLLPYGLYDFRDGGSGADVGQLKKTQQPILLAGFMPDSQRYFDYHHANTDTFAAVNKRELELGAASISALMYLISEYGF